MEFYVPEWVSCTSCVINYIGSFGIIIPALLGWRYRARLSAPMRAVWWYCVYWSLEAPVNVYCRRVLHQNHPLHHLDVLVETWLLGWAYYEALGRRHPAWWLVAGAVFTGVVVANATVWSDIFHDNAYARTAQTILLVTVIMLYFEQWIHAAFRQARPLDGMFYVSAGELIYYAGSITGYVLGPYARIIGGDAQAALGLVIDSLFLLCVVMLAVGFRAEARLAPPTAAAPAEAPLITAAGPG